MALLYRTSFSTSYSFFFHNSFIYLFIFEALGLNHCKLSDSTRIGGGHVAIQFQVLKPCLVNHATDSCNLSTDSLYCGPLVCAPRSSRHSSVLCPWSSQLGVQTASRTSNCWWCSFWHMRSYALSLAFPWLGLRKLTWKDGWTLICLGKSNWFASFPNPDPDFDWNIILTYKAPAGHISLDFQC